MTDQNLPEDAIFCPDNPLVELLLLAFGLNLSIKLQREDFDVVLYVARANSVDGPARKIAINPEMFATVCGDKLAADVIGEIRRAFEVNRGQR